MEVLVTGVAGFIGAALAEQLLARGDTVIGVDSLNDYYPVSLKLARRDRLKARGGSRFTFRHVDFADEDALDAALASHSFDMIVHLGAQAGVRYSLEAPRAYVRANVLGHLNMLEIARRRAVRHLLYASSSSVYGGNTRLPFSVDDRVDRPLSMYAATKKSDELMSETYAHLHDLPQTGLRFFTVYGPWGRPDMMLWRFTERIFAGEPIPVFNNGEMWRDFTHIDDIVKGILACLDSPPRRDGGTRPGGSTNPHAIYNIGNNRSEHLMDVVRLLERECDRPARLEMLPMQPGEVVRTYADIEAITRDHGFRPSIGIGEGIPSFVRWFREYHQQAA